MSFLSGFLPKFASGIVGKLFGGKKRSTGTDFAQLRRDAEAAGFNALTALRATGAVGYNRAEDPSLSTSNFIAQAVEEGASTWFNERQKKKDAEAEKLRRDLSRQQAEEFRQSQRTPSVSDSYGYSVEETTQSVLSAEHRPKARPTIHTVARMPVFMPDGSPRQIPRDVAERLAIKPFGVVSPGDYAELVGEIRGEGESTLWMKEIADTMGIPILFGPPPPEKPKSKPRYDGPTAQGAWGQRLGQ